MSRLHQLILELEAFENFERLLEHHYPYIHCCCQNGINDFLEAALAIYQPDLSVEQLHESVEAYIKQLDYQLGTTIERLYPGTFSESTAKEIYSYDFYLFLVSVFEQVLKSLQCIVLTHPVRVQQNSFEYHGRAALRITIELL